MRRAKTAKSNAGLRGIDSLGKLSRNGGLSLESGGGGAGPHRLRPLAPVGAPWRDSMSNEERRREGNERLQSARFQQT